MEGRGHEQPDKRLVRWLQRSLQRIHGFDRASYQGCRREKQSHGGNSTSALLTPLPMLYYGATLDLL